MHARELLGFPSRLQVGGDSMEAQFAELAGNPDVIIATPGRLAHHLSEVAGFGLKTVEYVVFDEADRWDTLSDVSLLCWVTHGGEIFQHGVLACYRGLP